SIGRDNTGNTEAMKTNGEACTHVKGGASEITLLMPNGGEKFCAGAEVNIAWLRNTADPVDLYYSADNGNTYTSIAAGQPGTGAYTWQVPSPLPASDAYIIKVSGSDDKAVKDSSDNAFTIGNNVLNAGA